MLIASTDRLRAAYIRGRTYAVNTPILSNSYLNERWKAEVFLKCEQLQPIGAFKIRGATNFTLSLSKQERSKGLITHSSGNHAQAVAYVAAKLGLKSWVVMPENSNRVKMEAARKWGANILLCEPTITARLEMAELTAQNTGGVIIPPFDHRWIIEGQAAAAMEMIATCPQLDIVCVPLGGGGLLAGTSLATKTFSPSTKVLGAEPSQADDGQVGFRSGKRVTMAQSNTIADGLRTTVGAVPYEVILQHVDDIITASDDMIVKHMYEFWQHTKMIIEPSSAVPIAALDFQKESLAGKKIGIILTGGNVDFSQLPQPV